MSFDIFEEAFYLKSYPDVAAAVPGAFQSGLEHLQKFGLKESRVLVSPLYDEGFYLQKNPDVAAAVAAGDFSSGLQHYRIFGEAEGRSGTTFNEFGYRDANPDVAAAIAAGALNSGLEHYIKFGQFENRTGVYFSGTSGNDTVSGFGNQDTICGVDLSPGACVIGGTPTGGECLDFRSLGVNEADLLIGGAGNDTFVLGIIPNSRVYTPLSFYTGAGDADLAVIENFEVGKDRIQLAGFHISDYLFQTYEVNVNIYYALNGGLGSVPSPDLVAVVRGVTSLSESDGSIYLL